MNLLDFHGREKHHCNQLPFHICESYICDTSWISRLAACLSCSVKPDANFARVGTVMPASTVAGLDLDDKV